MSKLFEQLLKVRGIDSSFLNLKYEDLTDPFILPDMQKAVDRLKKALERNEKVLIYGDYDADGVTASTVLESALKIAGFKPQNLEIMLPNRFTDGYGMSSRLVEYVESEHINLVVTVDCGSRSHEIIKALSDLKVDTIVTDHHETADTLPAALAVINPKRQDFKPLNGLENLAGVGVAFKVAEAMTKIGLIPAGQEKWLLDLVLIGTICDSMILTGENRILCYFGFIVLGKTRRPGLKELIRLSKVKTLNSEAVGFQLGPRLNAAGRLKDARLALNLLRTTSETEAAALAAELEKLNKKRKDEQRFAMSEIREKRSGNPDDPVIVEVGDWNEGVLGIIAGHLVEDYSRPAFVLTEVEDEVLKGSGRSFGDFNLSDALKAAGEVIISGGGHACAAGVRLKKECLADFRAGLNDHYKSLNLKDQEKFLRPSADLSVEDFSGLTMDFLNELKTLEPFGLGNEEPIFRLNGFKISAVTKMGAEKNHLRLDLKDKTGRTLKLIAFFAPESWLNLTKEDEISPLVCLSENEFKGVKSIEARICDIIFL